MIRRAMIMAAGLGTRMRPLTDDRPKPLVTVRRQALIDHAIDRLVAAGVRTGRGQSALQGRHAARASGQAPRRRNPSIPTERTRCSDTGGGVVKALPHFEGEPFFILNSDSIWVEGSGPRAARHEAAWDESRMDGLLLLAAMITALGYEGGAAISCWLADGHVAGCRSGRCRLSPIRACRSCIRACSTIRRRGVFSTNLLWDRAIAKDRLYGMRLDGVWMHVGTPRGARRGRRLSRRAGDRR